MARHNDILTQFREIMPVFDYKNNSHKNLVSFGLYFDDVEKIRSFVHATNSTSVMERELNESIATKSKNKILQHLKVFQSFQSSFLLKAFKSSKLNKTFEKGQNQKLSKHAV